MSQIATYGIAGVDLDQWDLMLGSTYRAPVATRLTSMVVPGRHGHLAAGARTFTAPQLTLVLSPLRNGTSVAAFEALNDALTALAAMPTLLLTKTVDGVTREAEARLLSLNWDPTAIQWGRVAEATLTLEIPGVFWRDRAWALHTVPAGATVDLADLAGTGPTADAMVRFASGTNATLTDVVSGTSIGVSGTQASYSYVDLATMQAWYSPGTQIWAPTAERLDAQVTYGGRGPLEITPQVGTDLSRSVRLTASVLTVIRARRAWL